ncbi:hypothetical protein [Glaciibacter psychrotolerans]|uniref:Uncharacterized protein n=1 Tax=Glaciibacter psychrotolerans TaxID=670054 RepID=A0A7Z0EFS9_9MICO|nr:hypothetical protein [Leifsonia psychrotolerans]NYJ20132.1 hypothetical protein [Leifsonia psychrotolerans]
MNDEHPDARDEEQTVASVRRILTITAERLRSTDAHDEALAQFVAPRRVLLVFTKDAVLLPVGRVWRLGVFLLAPNGTLYATGSTTRAVAPGYPGFQSVSSENRRDYRAAAFRGPFARGETVNFGASEVDLAPSALRTSTGPLFLRDERALVRWTVTASDDSAVDLEQYLSDRVGLLLERPAES